MQNTMTETLRVYKWPAQAFWRYFEVQALRKIPCQRPILEIGCGDGQFSGLVFQEIDDGIDVNPRAIEKCRNISGTLYRRVRCHDARHLERTDTGYATVYANCVMEHIPDLPAVLAGCYRSLRPGGKLVITVPLDEMNDHLLVRWKWYARMRQRQLVHLNLFTQEKWKELLHTVGFTHVEFHPYLSGEACRFWDILDSTGSIGFGRYRLGVILVRVTPLILPKSARDWLTRSFARWLCVKAEATAGKEPACALVVIAQKAVESATT
jgi:SAM-dependent methyltransferase